MGTGAGIAVGASAARCYNTLMIRLFHNGTLVLPSGAHVNVLA